MNDSIGIKTMVFLIFIGGLLIFVGVTVIIIYINKAIEEKRIEKEERYKPRETHFSTGFDVNKDRVNVTPSYSTSTSSLGTRSGSSYSGSHPAGSGKTYKLSEEKKEHVEITLYKYSGNNKWKCAYCEVENDYTVRKCIVCGKERT